MSETTKLHLQILTLALPTIILFCACEPKRVSDARTIGPRKLPQDYPRFYIKRVQEKKFACFPEAVKFLGRKGRQIHCESSAVTYAGRRLIMGIDKRLLAPNYSAVFKTGLKKDFGLTPLQYLTHPTLRFTQKWEDFTNAAGWVIATTAFNRHNPKKVLWNLYNTVAAWPVGSPHRTQIVNPSSKYNIESSVSLRAPILRMLRAAYPNQANINYFKIEGLAALPGGRLLLGIRSFGLSYKDYKYAVILAEAKYTIIKGRMVIRPEVTFLRNYRETMRKTMGQKIGLSSLEYNQKSGWLYMLTSIEVRSDRTKLGGFLWRVKLRDLGKRQPQIAVDAQNQPLAFDHKPEGVAIVGRKRLFILFDDDRIVEKKGVWRRRPNETFYAVVDIL